MRESGAGQMTLGMRGVKRLSMWVWIAVLCRSVAVAQVDEGFNEAFTEARALVWTDPDAALEEVRRLTETHLLHQKGRWSNRAEFVVVKTGRLFWLKPICKNIWCVVEQV